MSTSTTSSQTQIIKKETPQLGKSLRFLELLSKFNLMIFRSNEEKPRISIPKLVLAIILLLLGK
jgi:hypothetical protein